MKERRKIRSLVRRISAGDEKAFKEVYFLYYERLWRFAREYVMDQGEAENIVQNCFLKLWERRKSLDDDFYLGAWLFTVVKHNCLSFISHKNIVSKHSEDYMARELRANYSALCIIEFSENTLFDIQNIIESTLEQLSPGCRDVFELSRFKHKKHKDIAAELGISEKSVEAYITTALKKLRIALKDYIVLISVYMIIETILFI